MGGRASSCLPQAAPLPTHQQAPKRLAASGASACAAPDASAGAESIQVPTEPWRRSDREVPTEPWRRSDREVALPSHSVGFAAAGGGLAAVPKLPSPAFSLEQIAAGLGLPDSHLLLGMKKSAVRRFCAEIGFPDRYDRKETFEYLHRAGLIPSAEDWITEAYPFSRCEYKHKDDIMWDSDQGRKCQGWVWENGLQPKKTIHFGRCCIHERVPRDAYGVNGYDLVHAIRRWLHETGNAGKSVAEVCLERGDEGVGPAGVFISHAQSEPLESTLAPVSDNVIAWLDYVCLRQLRPDFNPSFIARIIGHFGNTLAVEDATRSYLKRAFCVLEVAVTPQGCLTMPLNAHREDDRSDHQGMSYRSDLDGCRLSPTIAARKDKFIAAYRGRNKIDVQAATTRHPEDLALIHEYIRASGGFGVLDSMVKDALAAAGYNYDDRLKQA